MHEILIALINNLPQILTALGVILTAYFAYRIKIHSGETAKANKVIAESVSGRKGYDQ